MKTIILALSIVALHQAQGPAATPPAPKPCLAVVEAGSHGVRNFMLGGIAGALMSKMQYKVVAVRDYPAKVGQKFHGSDLQMFASAGMQVIILDKKLPEEEFQKACEK